MRIFAPGTLGGPCNGECHHFDCYLLIQTAAKLCVCCNRPAGFETEFTAMHDGRVVHTYHCPPQPPRCPVVRTFWRKVSDSGIVAHQGLLCALLVTPVGIRPGVEDAPGHKFLPGEHDRSPVDVLETKMKPRLESNPEIIKFYDSTILDLCQQGRVEGKIHPPFLVEFVNPQSNTEVFKTEATFLGNKWDWQRDYPYFSGVLTINVHEAVMLTRTVNTETMKIEEPARQAQTA